MKYKVIIVLVQQMNFDKSSSVSSLFSTGKVAVQFFFEV